MCWHRIDAVAAAAFRRARVSPASWRQRFPDARLKIHLRLNIVRILWTLLVIFHGKLWIFETQIIEFFFHFAQQWTVNHNSRFVKVKIRRSEFFNDGTCWRMILNSFSQLFIGDNREPLFSCLPPIFFKKNSTRDVLLANILWDVLVLCAHWTLFFRTFCGNVLVLVDVADVHQCSKVDLPYLLFLCAFFMTSFHSFSIVAFCIWNQHCLGWKIFGLILLGFPKHASLRDLQTLLNHT